LVLLTGAVDHLQAFQRRHDRLHTGATPAQGHLDVVGGVLRLIHRCVGRRGPNELLELRHKIYYGDTRTLFGK
jgi:hypothetical protein